MDQVASLSVLYAEVKMKKLKPLTMQQVDKEEEMGSLHEIKKGRGSVSGKTKASTEPGLQHKVCLPPVVDIQISSLPTL